MVERLTKEECLEELGRFEEEVPPSWALPEIRGYLVQKWLESGNSKARGVLQAFREDGNYNAELEKRELEALCVERKVPMSKADNRTSLIYKLMLEAWMGRPSTG